jgi:hypothetical protein
VKLPLSDIDPNTTASVYRLPKGWLIGSYAALCELADALKWDPNRNGYKIEALEAKLRKCRPRFGLRKTDRPPQREFQKKMDEFDELTVEEELELASDQGLDKLIARRTASPEAYRGRGEAGGGKNATSAEPRRAELYDEVRDFWISQTLQAHHIVEDNIVKKLGLRAPELARAEAPAVLLAPEFHQRYLAVPKAEREAFNNKLTPESAFIALRKISAGLYLHPVLAPLGQTSDLIIRRVCTCLSAKRGAAGS